MNDGRWHAGGCPRLTTYLWKPRAGEGPWPHFRNHPANCQARGRRRGNADDWMIDWRHRRARHLIGRQCIPRSANQVGHGPRSTPRSASAGAGLGDGEGHVSETRRVCNARCHEVGASSSARPSREMPVLARGCMSRDGRCCAVATSAIASAPNIVHDRRGRGKSQVTYVNAQPCATSTVSSVRTRVEREKVN